MYFLSGIAYGDGTVYALNYSGELTAFAAASGAVRWSIDLPDQWSFDAPPNIDEGTVYVQGSGWGDTLYAVDAATGRLLWKRPGGADHSSPTVGPSAVYLGGNCNQVFRHARRGGQLDWRFTTGCYGGGGRTTVLDQGLLFSRLSDYRLVLDVESARVVSKHDGVLAPAVGGGGGFFVDAAGDLVARDVPSMTPRWTFSDPSEVVTAPVVSNGTVYAGTGDGKLLGLRAADGELLWRATAPGGLVRPDEHNAHQLTGMAVGEGLFVISTPGGVRAYVSAAP